MGSTAPKEKVVLRHSILLPLRCSLYLGKTMSNLLYRILYFLLVSISSACEVESKDSSLIFSLCFLHLT